MMPKAYPKEFRHRAVALVRAGRPATEVALSLGISTTCSRNWVRRDRIDHGEIAGRSTTEKGRAEGGAQANPRART